jgi:hypothetical protein
MMAFVGARAGRAPAPAGLALHEGEPSHHPLQDQVGEGQQGEGLQRWRGVHVHGCDHCGAGGGAASAGMRAHAHRDQALPFAQRADCSAKLVVPTHHHATPARAAPRSAGFRVSRGDSGRCRHPATIHVGASSASAVLHGLCCALRFSHFGRVISCGEQQRQGRSCAGLLPHPTATAAWRLIQNGGPPGSQRLPPCPWRGCSDQRAAHGALQGWCTVTLM